MKITLEKALSFYLTGKSSLSHYDNDEWKPAELTQAELDDLETTQEEFKQSQSNSFKFKNQVLNLTADLNTVQGQFRLAGLGVVDSLFSGIGAGFGSKMNFFSGLTLAGISLVLSYFQNLPFLSTKFSIFSFGGKLVRGPLHVFDSIFSLIGEHGSRFAIPSLASGLVSLFSLKRTLRGNDDKSFKLPFDTVGGTLGRSAIHHVDSMLASKASQISNQNEKLGAFLASSITTLGLLVPEKLRRKKIPWDTLEGFIAQGGSHFIDSLFSSIGNVFSSVFNNNGKLLVGTCGVALGMPLIGSILNNLNYTVPFGTLEGRLVRGILHTGENFAFNLGTNLGDSLFGIPLTLGFVLFTYLTCLSNGGKNLLKNFQISRDKIGGLVQRIPFNLVYSLISACGLQISKKIPAPLLLGLGPVLSFQLGEKFKKVDAKFDDLKGLMLRNSTHLWETILARAAYKTGRMITGTLSEETQAGSILADGRWLTEEGRIVPTMAIGKQVQTNMTHSLKNILISSLGGVAFSLSAYRLGKFILSNKEKEVPIRFQFITSYLRKLAVKLENLLGRYFFGPGDIRTQGDKELAVKEGVNVSSSY